ncbi:hypothetical protein ACFWWC_43580 [Streptomyces sp. NPDC058642]|uniref:hypothetical protein n=1 Tax=Streptomyces sp. NPDC058642 TaxID=3346572 RepID=UPI00364DA9FF
MPLRFPRIDAAMAACTVPGWTDLGQSHLPPRQPVTLHEALPTESCLLCWPDARSVRRQAAKAKSLVPVWREQLACSVLSVDYQRILQALADRHRLHQGPLTCQEMAVAFGLDAVPTKVEALRPKAKRLVARGWLAERQPGRFTLAPGKATRHEHSHRPADHRLGAGGAAFEVACSPAPSPRTPIRPGRTPRSTRP